MNALIKYGHGIANYIRSLKSSKIEDVEKELKSDKKKRPSYALQRQREFRTDFEQQDLKDAIMLAEDPEHPRRYDLLMNYKEFMRDLHLQSQIRTAIYKVISEPASLYSKKSKKPDSELTKLFKAQWFEDVCWIYLLAEFYGFSVIEFGEMKPDPNFNNQLVFKRVKDFPREHVSPEKQMILIRPTDLSGIPLDNPLIKKWILFCGDQYDLGLLADCGKHSIYKKYGYSDWSRSTEKWSDPILAIKSSSDNDKENDKKEEMAANFGNNGYVILDEDDDITLVERSNGTGYQIFKDFIESQNSENSKGVNGQVATADEKSFVGSAEVQERILNDYTIARLRALTYFVNDELIPYLVNCVNGETAYKALDGFEWTPNRFLDEEKKPKPKKEKEDDGGDPIKKLYKGFNQ